MWRKTSISLEDDLYERVREAAGPDGASGWLTDALARLRARAFRSVADEIAQETGCPYTEQELNEARQRLPSSSTQAR
jgi:hypothetical protein